MKQRLKRLTRISKGIQRNLAEFEASLVGPKFAIVLEQKELEKRSKQRRPRRKLRIRKRELCFSKRESDNKLFITNYLVRNMQNNASIVRYSGISSGSLCGYCKSTKVARRETFGAWAYRLNVSHYLCLLDRGWRRSGKYLYKPIMEKTCCPQYTIRLDVHKFRLSRTQKRILRTMLEFLKWDKRPARAFSDEDHRPRTSKQEKGENTGRGLSSKNKSTISTEHPSQKMTKKKIMRRKRAEEKLIKKGVDLEKFRNDRAAKERARQRTLESFLEEYVEGEWKHKLEVCLVSLNSEQFKSTFEESFEVYKKYQTSIHNDDDLTPSGFSRFLASSPLFDVKEDREVYPILGSYHQQYVLDGRIIAVGVVDVLPRCMSSKYFYYDPDWKFLTLGTYSALREIAFTKSLSTGRPALHYYYMGYYLWVPLSDCEKMLEANEGNFTVFCPNDLPPAEEVNLDQILCVINETVVPFSLYRSLVSDPSSLVEKLKLYVKFAGPVAKEIMLRFEYKHSFRTPNLAQRDGSIPFWVVTGDAIASSEQLRLAPSMRSRKGIAWNKRAMVESENFEMEIALKVTGQGRIGADGLAIWYTHLQGTLGLCSVQMTTGMEWV
uniref:arginyltransferase n=1 Tax=Ditylenchus dipsaci TaxID=166011 RepID=A0A915ELU2_9BILA